MLHLYNNEGAPLHFKKSGYTNIMRKSNKTNITSEDYVYSTIREKIRTGEYAPGFSLKEKELSESFNVSRTPVRAALKKLSYDGMVTIVPRIGAQVRHITPKETNELLEVREVIDGLSARLAAQRINHSQVMNMEKILNEMSESIDSNNLVEYIRGNDRFHCYIAEVSGNVKVSEIIQLTSIRLMRIQLQDFIINSRAQQSLKEHQQLLTLIKKGDAEQAEKVAREHVANILNTIQDLEKNLLYY